MNEKKQLSAKGKADMYQRRIKQYKKARKKQRATEGQGVEPAQNYSTLKKDIKNLDEFFTGSEPDGVPCAPRRGSHPGCRFFPVGSRRL